MAFEHKFPFFLMEKLEKNEKLKKFLASSVAWEQVLVQAQD